MSFAPYHSAPEKLQSPVPFALAIPAGFAAGMTDGQVTTVDGFTARVQLSPPLFLSENSSAYLIQASIAYSQPNVGPAASVIPGFISGNNRISIDFNAGGRTDYFFPQGLYSVEDIETQLNLIASNAGWLVNPMAQLFAVTGIPSTQTVILTVNPAALTGGVFPAGGIVIDFLNPSVAAINNSIGPILGWPTLGAGAVLTIPGGGATAVAFSAPNTANFALTSAYALFASFVTDSYQNGLTGKLLSVFPLGSFQPNSVMTFMPSLKYPVPTASSVYSAIDFYFTDQSGNRLLLTNFQAPTQFSILIARTSPTGS